MIGTDLRWTHVHSGTKSLVCFFLWQFLWVDVQEGIPQHNVVHKHSTCFCKFGIKPLLFQNSNIFYNTVIIVTFVIWWIMYNVLRWWWNTSHMVIPFYISICLWRKKCVLLCFIYIYTLFLTAQWLPFWKSTEKHGQGWVGVGGVYLKVHFKDCDDDRSWPVAHNIRLGTTGSAILHCG
jgi:hypothetical protein